jgi:tetratricopeptide (TPR) repeat protein
MNTRLVSAALLLLPLGWLAWPSDEAKRERPAAADAASPTAAHEQLLQDLHAVRRSYDAQRLDAFIASQQAALQTSPDDAIAHRILAEALLERCMLRTHRLGMRVGKPTVETLDEPTEADLGAAEKHVLRARELGDETAANHRIEARLCSQRITGALTGIRFGSRVESALQTARELDPQSGEVHVAIGLRKLMAPQWFGQDWNAALEDFCFAAGRLPHDERPRVFAGMACHLLERREQALQWLEEAVQLNPSNAYARAVLKRLRDRESDPFGRDVTEAELQTLR